MSKTTIPVNVSRAIWFAAYGRCEFAGCNKRLDVHDLTMGKCNISNYAHIIGDSPKGPRGDKEKSPILAQDTSNIMLLCPECHKLIDKDVEKYTVDVLMGMKKEHEERIERVTGIQPNKKSLVVVFGSKIGRSVPAFHKDVLFNTLFPDCYPLSDRPIEILTYSVIKDCEEDFWKNESGQIEEVCRDKILEPLKHGEIPHISLFALAPQPLLVKLGTVLNDKYKVMVYQKHRIPDTWRWLEEDPHNDIRLIEPESKDYEPILVIALSSETIINRINERFGGKASIWTISCDNPNNDMLKSYTQLVQFNRVARRAIEEINSYHRGASNVKIFMAAPNACAVELGRIRMEKADLPWVIYDYRNEIIEDIETVTIN